MFVGEAILHAIALPILSLMVSLNPFFTYNPNFGVIFQNPVSLRFDITMKFMETMMISSVMNPHCPVRLKQILDM